MSQAYRDMETMVPSPAEKILQSEPEAQGVDAGA